MMYSSIYSFNNNKWINLNSNHGKKLLKNYIKSLIYGGASPSVSKNHDTVSTGINTLSSALLLAIANSIHPGTLNSALILSLGPKLAPILITSVLLYNSPTLINNIWNTGIFASAKHLPFLMYYKDQNYKDQTLPVKIYFPTENESVICNRGITPPCPPSGYGHLMYNKNSFNMCKVQGLIANFYFNIIEFFKKIHELNTIFPLIRHNLSSLRDKLKISEINKTNTKVYKQLPVQGCKYPLDKLKDELMNLGLAK